MIKRILTSVGALLLALLSFTAQAQRITDPVLKNIVKSNISFSERNSREKLYLQTDKPAYLTGDTLRLKAYLLNADYRSESLLSGILYVELDNEAGQSLKRIMLPVQTGLAWGDVVLDTAEIKQGNYTLRAYTNWMRNFGEDYIFKKHITVSAYNGYPLLVNSLFKQIGNKVEAGFQLKQLNGMAYSFKDVEVKLMNGRENLLKDKLITGPDGTLQFNFALPQNKEPLSIKLLTGAKEELQVPINVNRPENTDIQFLPEGGQLVAGLKSKVGIKAIGEDGRGYNISGIVFSSKGQEVATINTTYKGMGNFAFTPQAGETYTAKIKGITKTYSLPIVKPSGTVLGIDNTNPDSLILNIQLSPNSNQSYYLIGQARGLICYAQPIMPNQAFTKNIDKKLFPTGVARFTLLNSDQQPVNERIVFINHEDELNINILPGKSSYNTRDSISLAIQVTDKTGQPIQGNFSMAVTDNSQVKIDSLGSNLLTGLLLTSDLKGEIETPGYYFTGNKAAELDNLMLTQGWVGYDWKEVMATENRVMTHQAEREFLVRGRVTNAFGKPVEKSSVALFSKSPLIVADTLTDKDGYFVFKDIWPVDTAIFKLQARNKKNKEFNVGISITEQIFPQFNPAKYNKTPWYVNIDTTLINNANSSIAENKARENYKGSGNILKEVNIKAKKIVKQSNNLNGPGEADLVLDEEDMLKARKKTLTELLDEKIPGIAYYGNWRPCLSCKSIRMSYLLYGKKLSFIFDGLDIDKFTGPLSVEERWSYIKSFLDYYTAEEVVGVELMFNSRYSAAYASSDFKNLAFDAHAFIEITTRGKQGPFMKVTPGTYLYRPMAFTMPKQFYSPKYNVNNRSTAPGIDMRSTIFWEPNIFTDVNGKATVNFYSADKLSNYTVIIEGTDMNGQFGSAKTEVKLATE